MTTSPTATPAWSITGTYFESCNCDAACPCVFLSMPTQGECTALFGWHIAEGRVDDLQLDDLNVALAVHSPGNMAQVPWTVALYLDERADGKQADALTRIFTGQLGGHPERLASHIGNVLAITSVSIDFVAKGRRRSLKIGDVAAVDIEGVDGQQGQPVTVTGHPLCIAPDYPAELARSNQLSYHDHGLNWDLSEKNGFFSPFAYQA